MMLELHRSDTAASDVHFLGPALPGLEHAGLFWPRFTGVVVNATSPKSPMEQGHELSHLLWGSCDQARSIREGFMARMYVANDIVSEATPLETGDVEGIFEHLRDSFPELFRLNEELAEVATIDAGWHGPGSLAPGLPALRLARKAAFALLADNLPLPHAFPTPDGGVSLEWTLGPIEGSLTVEPDATTVTFSAWNSLTDEHEYEQEIEATPAEIRDWVAKLATNR